MNMSKVRLLNPPCTSKPIYTFFTSQGKPWELSSFSHTNPIPSPILIVNVQNTFRFDQFLSSLPPHHLECQYHIGSLFLHSFMAVLLTVQNREVPNSRPEISLMQFLGMLLKKKKKSKQQQQNKPAVK